MSYDSGDEYDGSAAPRQGRPNQQVRGRSSSRPRPPARPSGGGRAAGPGADYIEVKDRVVEFYEKHSAGAIRTGIVEYVGETHLRTKSTDHGPKEYPYAVGHVIVRAEAYRDATDPLPAGTGHSIMLMPGTTPYTEGSELENAETSAVGRALAMMGIAANRGLSSRNEIDSKRGDDEPTGRPERAERSTDASTGPTGQGDTSRTSPGQTPDLTAQAAAIFDVEGDGLTGPEMARRLRDNYIPAATAAAMAKRLWPEARSGRDLSDEQRMTLWLAVKAEYDVNKAREASTVERTGDKTIDQETGEILPGQVPGQMSMGA